MSSANAIGAGGGQANFGFFGGAGGAGNASSLAASGGMGNTFSYARAAGGAGGDAATSGAGGAGGVANSSGAATSNAGGNASSSATATGGAGGNGPSGNSEFVNGGRGGAGGDADANSAAKSSGAGNASSFATATGGEGGEGSEGSEGSFNIFKGGDGGQCDGDRQCVRGRRRPAAAAAVATGGIGGAGSTPRAVGAANATSSAQTAKGALDQAQSTALGSSGQAQSTAKSSLAGVSVQSSASAPTGGGTATTNAVAQGGSGQAFGNPGQTAYTFSTALPDKGYATTLISGASNVASALLGPRDVVFGTAILGANYAPDGGGVSNIYSASSTSDFGYGGDLQLGLIDDQVSGFAKGLGFQSMEFTIQANGVEVFDVTFGSLAIAESFFRDDVIDLGADFGPSIDLTFCYTLLADGVGGFGFDFAFGGAVPEPSTWAMMLLGFAGLGFAGHRSARQAGRRGCVSCG
jgi:hypothetical protein